MAAWNASSDEVSHGDGGRNDEYTLTKTRLNGGGGRGDHGEARGKLGNAFLRWCVSEVTAELHDSVAEAAARGGDEGKANGAGERVGQALAFFWRSNTRRGGFGRA